MYRWCTDEQLAVIQRQRDELHAAMRDYFRTSGMDEPVKIESVRVSVSYPEGEFVHHYPPVQGIVPEKEVAVPPERRIGDARRNEYTDHLSFMFQGGYISQSDFSTRMGRAAEALTEHDLKELIQDLPPLSEGKRMLPEVVKEKEPAISTSMAFGFSAAAMAMLTVLVSMHFSGYAENIAGVLAFFWMTAFGGFAWITRKK